jgi:hypothetical protein
VVSTSSHHLLHQSQSGAPLIVHFADLSYFALVKPTLVWGKEKEYDYGKTID